MKTDEFFAQLDEASMMQAIRAAEAVTSGEIRVVISRDHPKDPVRAAQQQFVKLGMSRTRERNGVLIFLAPHAQNFAVVGDEAVHQKCGAGFWEEVAAAMEIHLRAGRFTEAICCGVHRCGEVLAREFPRRVDDRNELPDGIVRE